MNVRIGSKAGFTLIEVLVIVAVLTTIGALGYVFYGRMNNQVAKDTSQTRVANDVQTAPQIKDASDLDDAEAVLDQADPAASDDDLAQLENMASEF